jgi:hypothetical protein
VEGSGQKIFQLLCRTISILYVFPDFGLLAELAIHIAASDIRQRLSVDLLVNGTAFFLYEIST